MDQNNSTATAETAAEKKAVLKRLLAMLHELYLAVRAFVRALLGMGSEAVGELRGDAVAIAKATRRGVEATGRIVGTGLEGPARVLDATAGAVGATLGALLPQRPVTPADVARGAVARDDRRDGAVATAIPFDVADGPMAPPALTPDILVKAHAQASLDTTGRLGDGLIPLEPRYAAWLATLNVEARKRVASASTRTIAMHLDATRDDERILGVPALPSPGQFAVDRTRVAGALAILKALPSTPDLNPVDAFRALGVEDTDDQPVARYGR